MIYSNIDWAFGNASWLTRYSSLEAIFENPRVLDHSPIIINTVAIKSYLQNPFRLYNLLLNNKEFEKAVNDVWCQQIHGHTMYSIWVKLQRLKDKVGQLNKEVSSLERNLDKLRVQLQIVQGKLDVDPFND